MEAEFLWFPGVEVDHVVILHFSAPCKIIDVFRVDVPFVSDINQLEQIYQVEVIVLR